MQPYPVVVGGLFLYLLSLVRGNGASLWPVPY